MEEGNPTIMQWLNENDFEVDARIQQESFDRHFRRKKEQVNWIYEESKACNQKRKKQYLNSLLMTWGEMWNEVRELFNTCSYNDVMRWINTSYTDPRKTEELGKLFR